MIGAVRDVDHSSVAGGCGAGMAASGGAGADELPRQKVALERSSEASSDLPLVVRAEYRNGLHPLLLIRPRSSRHEMQASLVHVDDQRWMHLSRSNAHKEQIRCERTA